MSTRWYPLYRAGNPQLRVFLPNFFMKALKPEKEIPENVVKFQIPLQMTKFDVKNYLEKIYGVDVVSVTTHVQLGKIVSQKYKKYLVKEDDFKIAYVTLPQGNTFKFPNLFPREKVDEQIESMEKQQKEIETYEKSYKREDPLRKGLPGWFSL